MPSSNPTTGLNVAAYVHVAGPNITPAGGLTGGPTNDAIGGASSGFPQGQGTGAVPNAAGSPAGAPGRPVAQYALTLSLSNKTVNGVRYMNTCEAVASLVDVADNTVLTSEYYQDNFVWEAYCAPASNAVEGWYRPNNGTAGPATYNACVVTLGAPYGTYDVDDVITANAVGQCIVEVQYPTFDNSLGDNDGYNISEQGPIMMIYAQIIVTVIP